MELKNRKVARFRTHIDPMIGPKPRNAFDFVGDLKHWQAELCPAGVAVTTNVARTGQEPLVEEHIIPFASIQSIKLVPLEKDEDDKKKA